MSNATPAAPGIPPAPPEKKQSFVKRHPVTTVFLILAVLGVCAIGGCAALVNNAVNEVNKSVSTTEDQGRGSAEKKDSGSNAAGSATTKFQDHLKSTGTSQEQAAAGHVTRVQGAGGFAPTVSIHTNYSANTDGMAAATLLADNYAAWKHTDGEDGLISVYSANGDLIGTANF
ncbi:hypothetical protein [Streptomyces sp. NPDC051684]|uniref:hypothetical protein n=1 Tax=Streptomyces sp. NPDC051684 TaxID=3365670 RepID=UPI0037A01202